MMSYGTPKTPQEWVMFYFFICATYIIGICICEKYRIISETTDYRNNWIGTFNRWKAGMKRTVECCTGGEKTGK